MSSAGSIIALVILVAVAAGFSPGLVCIPHWYVSFSIAADVTVTNGGDGTAELLSMLIIPICLADNRLWLWQTARTRTVNPAHRGSAYAAHLVLRVQVACIYLDSAISKLCHPAWRHGTALRLLVNDPAFGVAQGGRSAVDRIMAFTTLGPSLTYLALLTELMIGLSMCFNPRGRRVGFILAVVLHGAIILIMGIFSFGVTMISLLLITCAGTFTESEAELTETSGEQEPTYGQKPTYEPGHLPVRSDSML